MEIVTSTTSFNTKSSSTSPNANQQLKQELSQLVDNFDKKFNELMEIRDQMKKVISEIS